MHVFGATLSPSCTKFALCECAQDKGQFSQDTVDKILHCFYVHDWLVLVASEEEALSVYHDFISPYVLEVDSSLQNHQLRYSSCYT